jgi:hypothetical protein
LPSHNWEVHRLLALRLKQQVKQVAAALVNDSRRCVQHGDIIMWCCNPLSCTHGKMVSLESQACPCCSSPGLQPPPCSWCSSQSVPCLSLTHAR